MLIDYSIHDAARAGFRQVVIVTRPELHDQLAKHLHTTWGNALTFRFVDQELSDLPDGAAVNPERHAPWGTGHAVLAVRNVVRGPFVVINCDDFYGRDAYRSASEHLRSPTAPHALVGFRLDETLSQNGGVSRAECHANPTGHLERLTEFLNVRRKDDTILGTASDGTHRSFSGLEVVSMNFWVFQPTIFPLLEQLFGSFLGECGQDLRTEFFLSNAINKIVANNAAVVTVLPSAARWFGMTYQDDLAHVVDSLASLTDAGTYPRDIASVATST